MLVKRGNHVYAYRSVRRDGQVKVEYLAAGPAAIMIERQAKRQRAKRLALRKARQRSIDALVKTWRKIEEEISDLSQKLNAHFGDAMNHCGYYCHKRGEWRRRSRMSLPLPGSQDLAEAVSIERARRLFDQAGADIDTLFERLGGRLGKRVQERLIAKISADAYMRESLRREADELKRDLEGDRPTVIERLIIERIVVAWLSVAWADFLYVAFAGDISEPEIGSYVARLRNRNNRNYLGALKSLHLIRKAAPTVTVDVKNVINIQNNACGEKPFVDRVARASSSRN